MKLFDFGPAANAQRVQVFIREKGIESIITTTDGFIGWHLTVWLDSVLKAEELPASVTDLDTGLSDVD